ncbi:hypothetical protein JKG47_20485 [Acidithiobacillus sp. MC6.1]|nr:hypothetical protein [Acidithiobacillus sp. MC6.1]
MSLVERASHGAAIPISTFPGPHGFVGVIYRAQGVTSASGKPLYALAWAMPKAGMIGLGKMIDAQGNIISGPTGFALDALRAPMGTATGTTVSTGPLSATAVTASGASASVQTPDAALVNAETAALISGKASTVSPGKASPDVLDEALSPTNSFVEGGNGPVITVFASPDSKRALALYNDTLPLVKKGQLRIRWVPTGTGARSLAISESILSAPNPETSWALNFHTYNQKMHVGGVQGESNVQMEEIVDGNTEILARMGHVHSIEAFYCDNSSAQAVEMPAPITSESLAKVLKFVGSDCA